MTKLKKLSDLEFTNRLVSQSAFLFEKVKPTPLSNPILLHTNHNILEKLELLPTELSKPSFLKFVNGELSFDGLTSHASYYSGHQYGQFVPSLGDGRAIMICETKNSCNQFYEWQLKGSGLTPFSRMGDGKAVVRSSIREYLASAHMSALGIPTTEALAIILGEDPVRRESIEKAAIVLRISESFLRFGHLEFQHYHQKFDQLKKTVEVIIKNYFENFVGHPNRYNLFFQEIVKRTAKLMANWQSIGFCHGVMNTDNMSLLGLTIDYGPYGFIDKFDLDYICNISDHEGRYSFGNQPEIGKWNLEKLGIALSSLISLDDTQRTLATYETIFHVEYQRLLRMKIGLYKTNPDDENLIRDLLKMLHDTKLDYTNFFRQLCDFKKTQIIPDSIPEKLKDFLSQYQKRLSLEELTDEERQLIMKKTNPKFILRNYLAQICIEDNSQLEKVFNLLTNPYDEWTEFEEFSKPAPEKYQFICVSCSS